MQGFNHRWVMGAAAAVLLRPAPVTAQGAPGAAAGTAAAIGTAPAAHYLKVPAREVAARLSRAAGMLILADKTVATAPVTLDVPPGPLDATLARVAAALPKGSVVKKVLVPAPAPGAPGLDGDQVAALAAAQEALSASGGKQAAPSKEGEVDILGKRLAADKAAPVIAALDLRPVYVLTNPAAASDPVQKVNEAQLDMLRTWMSMTPEQQASVADQQFNALMNMDPAMRQQLFTQQRQAAMTIMKRMQSLPQDQRAQLFLEITGGKWDGTGKPPGGAGIPGGQGGKP